MSENEQSSPELDVHTYPPVNLTDPQLTLRAVLLGMVLGGVLSLCNIYAGLKIGWGFNMSITAALLSYGIFQALERTVGVRKWGILENNMNQTAASSAASISSAGLVAPIPALTMITGETLSYPVLVIWTLSVSLVGVVVAVGLRRQMLITDALTFPSGIATAETLKEMYAKGEEAMARVKMLLAGAGLAAGVKLAIKLFSIPHGKVPGTIALKATEALKAKGLTSVSMKNLTVAFDPSLIMVGVGAIIGMRACASIMLGAIFAWCFVGPEVIERAWVDLDKLKEGAAWFGPMNKWLLWPGVSMMVTASLTSFAFSWRSIVGTFSSKGAGERADVIEAAHEVPRQWFKIGLAAAGALAVVCQVAFFGIAVWTAAVGVLLTFLLAVVAARVSGETGITPVGPMGKVTQLLFGVIAPGDPAANLMAANVTGGAASQCADLLHDMKTGLMIGSSPRYQTIAQVAGVIAGAVFGCAGYLILVPDPAGMLLTNEWPAPAVAAWKAVAEIFMLGLDKMPAGTVAAIAWAGIAGIVLAIIEKTAPKRLRPYMLSPASIGLAFVIPAWNSMSMFFGGLIAVILTRYVKSWAARFLIVGAAGIIAGDSLTGVGIALYTILTG